MWQLSVYFTNIYRTPFCHYYFDKIILYKRKSKSVLEYTPKSVVCSSFKPENRNQTSVKSDADHRSRSAIAGKIQTSKLTNILFYLNIQNF